ncbi:HK97-gp10 family putative phage morphogenesis protein [Burkholderia pseudomallei]|uniref:HK97-gp10 family putative phage morphogenesis protein n=1 Tax=Burkholderia pseudomallei TaxID=28450 RepID=UPI000DD03083|nr:HK97-gp10 family putative phage morphogenesis protein [Burkholderia pseudomallei]
MAQGKSYSVENPSALTDAISNLGETFSESILRRAAAAGTTVFKDEIALRVPKDSGDLAEGLTVAHDQEDSVAGKIATYLALFVGDTRPKGPRRKRVSRRALAGWLENGTSKMPAQAFVRPAFEAVKQRAVDRANEVVLAALNKKGGS